MNLKQPCKIVLLSFLLATTSGANQAKPDKRAVETLPSQKALKQMSKNTLQLWNQAVQTKDFTAFYSSAATEWKRKSSPKTMRRAFQKFIDKKINIQSIQRLEPVFTTAPSIGSVKGHKGVLQISGCTKRSRNRPSSA
jgi:hypothetical protein